MKNSFDIGFVSASELEKKPIKISKEKESKKRVCLNSEQIDAINTLSGNLLIIASAGTGKTTTIVERYVNLVENHNYNSDGILMTTFTNKAAKDMIKKISKRTKKIPKWAGTMHSLFLRILRKYAHLVLNSENFTLITDDYDKKKIIKKVLEKEGLQIIPDNISYFLNRISRFKNSGVIASSLDENLNFNEQKGISEELIEDELIHIKESVKKFTIKIYKRYQEFLKQNNLVDFDDVLLFTYEILEKYPDIRQEYSNKFKIIMVDEAQDLNVVQIKILDLLENDNLCLIGDDCQNIYEWRGSSNELVFKFNNAHKKITLKENYRSTKKIISAINKSINALKFKIDKELVCTRSKGLDICVEEFSDFNSERDYLVYQIKRLLKQGVKKEDIAVLFRTNNLGKRIERELRRNKIPCHLSKSRSFFEREEVKDILAFLKVRINPYSIVDFERIVNLIFGIGEQKMNRLKEISIKENCSLVKALDFFTKVKIPDTLKDSIEKLKKSLEEDSNPIDLFFSVFDYNEKIFKRYSDDPEKLQEKQENILLLKELFSEYEFDKKGVREFLDSLVDLEKKEKEKDRIALTTIHSAKGLEWKYVFLAGCNETILPYYKRDLSTLKRDSELRLFYVAISRAKDSLVITHSRGNDWKDLLPSQFLDVIG